MHRYRRGCRSILAALVPSWRGRSTYWRARPPSLRAALAGCRRAHVHCTLVAVPRAQKAEAVNDWPVPHCTTTRPERETGCELLAHTTPVRSAKSPSHHDSLAGGWRALFGDATLVGGQTVRRWHASPGIVAGSVLRTRTATGPIPLPRIWLAKSATAARCRRDGSSRAIPGLGPAAWFGSDDPRASSRRSCERLSVNSAGGLIEPWRQPAVAVNSCCDGVDCTVSPRDWMAGRLIEVACVPWVCHSPLRSSVSIS